MSQVVDILVDARFLHDDRIAQMIEQDSSNDEDQFAKTSD